MATNTVNIPQYISGFLTKPRHIAPLAALRVIFGLCMVFSTARFMALGWVNEHFISTQFHFKYFGFEWVQAGSAWWMYTVHILLLLSSFCVMLGLYYRVAAWLQFFTFTYTGLIDVTYYLNHYYYISLVCLLLALLPAHRFFSLEVVRKPGLNATHVPAWCIYVLMLQTGIVYTYAGLAKINTDWLLNALPLKIWLPASNDVPLLGPLFAWEYAPYLFSWIGMLYDCTIVLWLLLPRTRPWAYITVVVFHALTGILFQIGVFPLVMIGAALIFFSADWHLRWMGVITRLFGTVKNHRINIYKENTYLPGVLTRKMGYSFLTLYFMFQLVFPWRYLAYPGNMFWTEEGYRFSWRVMLMEKAGTAAFFVKDTHTGREGEVFNDMFLNAHQEKQMAMQPDMIVQYAHFLADYYQKQGVYKPQVRAEVYVTLNGRKSCLYIDPEVDLSKIVDGWSHKSWILPDRNNEN